jgi:hypothetical protein
MATKIYDTETITLIDGTIIYLTPLKIKYLREFMDQFNLMRLESNQEDVLVELSKCTLIAMKQYYPTISTVEELEDSIDLNGMYSILRIGAGIKVGESEQDDVKQKVANSENTWENTDLAKLESEVFLLGIWKDYEDLERSLSMPELVATLESKRNVDYQEKKFLAAMQGVDLDDQTGNKQEDPWEAMKARVFGGGNAANSNDVVALQGPNAQKAGFGIGFGLDYEKIN